MKKKTVEVRCAYTKMVPVKNVKENPKNPNKHPEDQVVLLSQNIEQFGWRHPIIVSNRSGMIVAGHCRIQAARVLGLTEVPVDYQDFESEAEEIAVLLADNRIPELSEFDPFGTNNLLKELGDFGFDVGMIGFDDKWLDNLGVDDPTLTPEIWKDQDDAELTTTPDQLRDKWKVEIGQRWELGDHILVCGDSTQNDESGDCQTLIFDPEWDDMPKAIEGFDHILAFGDGARIGDVFERFGSPTWLFAWDCVTSWYTPNRPLRRMKLCAWYGPIGDYQFDGWHYGEPGVEHEVKNTRGEYLFKPDPRGKHLSDVFKMPITKLHSENEHKHSKPLDWIAMLIGNCTRGTVYDPYAGSGTTLFACEMLGRNSVCIEIEPANVAVVIEKWASVTKKLPVCVDFR